MSQHISNEDFAGVEVKMSTRVPSTLSRDTFQPRRAGRVHNRQHRPFQHRRQFCPSRDDPSQLDIVFVTKFRPHVTRIRTSAIVLGILNRCHQPARIWASGWASDNTLLLQRQPVKAGSVILVSVC